MFEKIVNWYKESNRYIHCNAGGVELVLLFISGLLFGMTIVQCALVSTISVAVTMVAVELKDKQQGGKFDVMDIVSGMIYPIIIDVLIFIMLLFNII